MFPAKARLDLSYYPQRTIVSDIVWMARGALAVVGWAPSQPIDV
jgi:lipopolysaccharide/colanic/teichoic acid biosynthesis glycosyltransferase